MEWGGRRKKRKKKEGGKGEPFLQSFVRIAMYNLKKERGNCFLFFCSSEKKRNK